MISFDTYNTTGGDLALPLSSTGSSNTAYGVLSLSSNTDGSRNTSVGSFALRYNSTGDANVAVGNIALTNNTTGFGNIAIGEETLYSNTAGGSNVAIGRSALFSNQTGNQNIALGSSALSGLTGGTHNIGIGALSINSNTAGFDNIGIGQSTLRNNTTGWVNIAMGNAGLFSNTSGRDNVAIGNAAGYGNTTGSRNVALGRSAGFLWTSGSDNVAIAHTGVAGDNRTIRIGTEGTHQDTFLAGILGNDLSATGQPVVIDASGQLGVGSAAGGGGGLELLTTIVVSPEGATAAANGAMLEAAVEGITGSGPDNPFAVYVEPGVYDIGTEVLDLPPNVALIGAGTTTTTIIGRATDTFSNTCGFSGRFVIVGGHDSELRHLTVKYVVDTNAFSMAAVFACADKTVHMQDVVVDMSEYGFINGSTFQQSGAGVRAQGSNASIQADGLTVIGANSAFIVQIFGNARLHNYRDIDSYFGIQVANGSIEMDTGETIDVRAGVDSQLIGRNIVTGDVTTNGSPEGELFLANSQVNGSVSGTNITCVNAYDGSFAPLSATCTP